MATTSADVIRVHKTEADLKAGGIKAGQKGFATDSHKQIHRDFITSAYFDYTDDTNQMLLSGAQSATGLKSFYDGVRLPDSEQIIFDFNDASIAQLGGDSSGDISLSATSNIRLSASDVLVHTTSETPAFYVKNNGDIGFGTSSPKLDTSSFDGNDKTITLYNETSASVFELASSASEGTIGAISFIADANGGTNPASNKVISQIRSVYETDGYGANEDGGQLEFYTKQYEGGFLSLRMVIDNDGDIGVNTPTPGYQLDVNGTGRFTGHLYANSNLVVGGSLSISDIDITDDLRVFGKTQFWNEDFGTNDTVSATFHFSPTIHGHTNASIVARKLDTGTALNNQETALLFQTSQGTNGLMTTIYQSSINGDVKVGINNETPLYELDVSGTTRVRGPLHLIEESSPTGLTGYGQVWTSASSAGQADRLIFTDGNGTDYLLTMTSI